MASNDRLVITLRARLLCRPVVHFIDESIDALLYDFYLLVNVFE